MSSNHNIFRNMTTIDYYTNTCKMHTYTKDNLKIYTIKELLNIHMYNRNLNFSILVENEIIERTIVQIPLCFSKSENQIMKIG